MCENGACLPREHFVYVTTLRGVKVVVNSRHHQGNCWTAACWSHRLSITHMCTTCKPHINKTTPKHTAHSRLNTTNPMNVQCRHKRSNTAGTQPVSCEWAGLIPPSCCPECDDTDVLAQSLNWGQRSEGRGRGPTRDHVR